MSEKKPDCFVRITGHKDAEDIEGFGRHHIKDGRHYIFFEKETEGIQEKFSLKIDEEGLEYSRNGVLKSTVVLRTGQQTVSQYVTPYGQFEMGFFTTSFKISKEDGHLTVNAGYDMTLNGQKHESGRINIEVEDRR